MTTNPSGSRSVFDLPPGQRTPVSVVYQNMEYPGEVVLAPTWQPELGAPLQGNCFFRIVFLQTHTGIGPQALHDARIAVCLPPRSDRQREHTLEQERRVLRELRARYAVPETERAFLESQRQLYVSGTVVTRSAVDLLPQTFFQGPSPEAWVARLGQGLLSWTYPRLPISSLSFPRPLAARDAGPLFLGVVAGDPSREVAQAMESFASGLGLLPGGEEGQVVRTLGQEMGQRAGTWPCTELYQRLAHTHGLPYPLVSLYLLAFVHRSRPPAELHLRPGHGLRLRDGSPYPGRVVVPETVSGLEFEHPWETETLLLRYASPASWNTVSLYFSNLEPSLAQEEPGEEQEMGRRLMAAMQNLQEDVQQVERGMERLANALGEDVPRESRGLIERFSQLSRARTAEDALQRARQLFGSPQGLTQAIRSYRPLRQAAEMSILLRDAARYLQEAHVPEGMRDLALQRRTLQAMLHMSELTTTPSGQAVSNQIQRFREEYQRAYSSHHEGYRQTLAAMLRRLRDSRGEANALAQLNSIPELGGPVGVQALERFHQLADGLTPCTRPPNQLALARYPVCRTCGVVLGQRPPSQDIATVVQEVQGGLKEQTLRLGTLVVHRVLQRPVDRHMARFIRMVEVANVSGLVQVLDDQVVAFVREVLRTP